MRTVVVGFLSAVFGGGCAEPRSSAERSPAAPGPAKVVDVAPPPAPPENPTSLYELSAQTLEGKTIALGEFRGKVVLAVNTASECGFTPQYEGLEALWRARSGDGLVVLGFPANDFGGQEPGSAAEIQSFCELRYGVSFPLFAKSTVVGAEASPVFRFLAREHGAPEWNFHKYLVGRDGKVIAGFASKVAPDDPTLTAAIDAALAAPAP